MTNKDSTARQKRILIAGGSGLIGQVVTTYFEQQDWEVKILTRRSNTSGKFVTWNPAESYLEEIDNPQFDVILNLSGQSIGAKAWTKTRRADIISSRLQPTTFIWQLLKDKKLFCDKYLNASAIGFYGHRPNEKLTEKASIGDPSRFLVDVTKQWEDCFFQNKVPGIEAAALRISLILSSKGGVLDQLKASLPFRIKPILGTGQQVYAWMHIEDVARAIYHIAGLKTIDPIYNFSAPNSVTYRTLMQGLEKATKKAWLTVPVPSFALRMVMGERADLILNSFDVVPTSLQDSGFTFKYPQINGALNALFTNKIPA